MTVGQFGVSPSEFWRMTPGEVWLIIETKRSKMVGGLREDDYERICEREEELKAQGFKILE